MAVDLRPLTLPELLDRSFSAFRRHLWLFVGIMAVPSVFAMMSTVLLQSFNAAVRPGTPPEQVWRLLLPVFVAGVAFSLIYAVAYAFACGATSIAVSELYQGRQPTVRSAYRGVRGHAASLVLLLLWIFLRIFGLVAGLTILTGVLAAVSVLVWRFLAVFVLPVGMLGTIVVMTWMFVRYGVAVPAVVLEDLGAGASLRRSVELTAGYRWRVFLLILCAAIIAYAAAAIFQGPFMAGAFLAGPGTTAALWLRLAGAVCGAVGGMFSGPIMIIGLAMLYFDLRIRKEALDLDVMLDTIDAAQPLPANARAVQD